MKPMTMKIAFLKTRLLLPVLVAVASLAATAHAAAPGITGPAFNLTAQQAYLTQPDGQAIYSWGYGCTSRTHWLRTRRCLTRHATPCRFQVPR